MKELRTEIEIEASPERVWQILTDFAKYPQWNPFITSAKGKAEVGAQVDIAVPRALHCTVIRAEPNRELCWKYHVVHPALFAGEHSFTIEPLGLHRIRFMDKEVFNGLLVPLQARDIDTDSRHGFQEMDKALKAAAEQA